MKVRAALGCLALGLGLSLSTLALAGSSKHEVDSYHAWSFFKVKHMGVSHAYGRFNVISGSVELDDADASKSAVEISIKTDSVDTANAKRDEHLKGADFFDAKQFPTITFKSTKVEKAGEALSVTGDLTLHGVTKSVTAKVEKTGEGKGMQGEHRTGFEASFAVKRSDFGMKWGLDNGAVGDDVQLWVSLEAIKK